MFEYNFVFDAHKIKFTVDVMGHEQVFVNNKRVVSSRKWTLKSCHAIDVGGTALNIELKVLSMISGQYQVSLFQEGECLESQIQTFSLSNKTVTLSKDELSWQKEIEMGSSYRVLANLLYFSLLVFGVLSTNFIDAEFSMLCILPVVVVTLLAIQLFIKDGFIALRQKEPMFNTDIKDIL